MQFYQKSNVVHLEQTIQKKISCLNHIIKGGKKERKKNHFDNEKYNKFRTKIKSDKKYYSVYLKY